MKIDDITVLDLKQYMRIDYEDEDNYLQNIVIPAVKQYIMSNTGLNSDEINEKEDLTIVFMILASDMYNNRDYTIQNDKVNVVADNILNRYSINLI